MVKTLEAIYVYHFRTCKENKNKLFHKFTTNKPKASSEYFKNKNKLLLYLIGVNWYVYHPQNQPPPTESLG